jgi:hypothetical protein
MMRRTQVLCLLLLIVLAIVAARIDHWIPRVCSVICGILAVSALFFQETEIDIERGRIVETVRLLGLVPVWRLARAVEDFVGVRCYCDHISEGAAIWVVSLQLRTGRPVDVRQFSADAGQDCTEAKAFAKELSDSTGLEVVDRVF